MTPERRTEIVDTLENSRLAFQEAVAGVTEEAAAICPGPDRWSVLQVVEHVALAERGMFGAFQAAQVSEVSLENKQKEARIVSGGVNRLIRFEAPERARPSGRFGSLAQALDQFLTARGQTIRFAAEHEGDLYFRTVVHPLMGPVNGYEQLLIMAAHAKRHAEQIAEIRAALPR